MFFKGTQVYCDAQPAATLFHHNVKSITNYGEKKISVQRTRQDVGSDSERVEGRGGGDDYYFVYFIFPSDFSTFSKWPLMSMYCFYNENNK